MADRLSDEAALRERVQNWVMQGRAGLAVDRLLEAMETAQGAGDLAGECLLHELLARAYEALGDAAAALRHYRRFHALDAQVSSERNERLVRAALNGQAARARTVPLQRRPRAPDRAGREGLRAGAVSVDEDQDQDALTGLCSRERLETAMRTELAHRHLDEPYSMALVDIDRLEHLLDHFPAETGHGVLRHIGAVLREVCRQDDLPVRLEGGRFALVLSNTMATDARIACERLRAAVEHHGWPLLHDGLSVTVSIGVAWRGETASPQATLALAGKRLDMARRGGCNRVVAVGGSADPAC